MFIILVDQVSYLRSSTKHKHIAETVIKINRGEHECVYKIYCKSIRLKITNINLMLVQEAKKDPWSQ